MTYCLSNANEQAVLLLNREKEIVRGKEILCVVFALMTAPKLMMPLVELHGIRLHIINEMAWITCHKRIVAASLRF